jgi:hypothetical protein
VAGVQEEVARDDRRVVARVPQDLGERRVRGVEATSPSRSGVLEGRRDVISVVKLGSVRRGGLRALEQDSFRGEGVEVRRRRPLPAVGAEVVGAQRVDADEEEVRALAGL